jgi:hypothetical protein
LPGGGDGTQTEDELYVGRKAGGGSVSSGDEDDIDDLEINRHTVQGASRPGERQGSSPTVKKPATLENAQGDAATTNPRGKKAATPVAPARGNCGTFWTAKVEDPEVDVNPCPKDCERGERQLVKPYKQGNKMLYEARFQCYRMAAVPQAKAGARLAPDNSPSGRARAAIEKPGAVPVGSVIPASGPWGVFARLKGPGFGGAKTCVRRGIRMTMPAGRLPYKPASHFVGAMAPTRSISRCRLIRPNPGPAAISRAAPCTSCC